MTFGMLVFWFIVIVIFLHEDDGAKPGKLDVERYFEEVMRDKRNARKK